MLAPRLRAAGAELLGIYVTETGENTFPRLPVREGEPVLVWFARFDDDDAHHRYEAALLADGLWNTAVAEALLDGLQATAAAAAPGAHAALGAARMRRSGACYR